jgi:ABC-type transporter MlaC component
MPSVTRMRLSPAPELAEHRTSSNAPLLPLRSSAPASVLSIVSPRSEKLSEYVEGGGPRVTGTRPEPDGVIVSSEIVRGSGPAQGAAPRFSPIKVDWRLSARDGTYKISDIVIGGLSMAANGRTQLEGVVERNGGRAQAILAVMRQQIASASSR